MDLTDWLGFQTVTNIFGYRKNNQPPLSNKAQKILHTTTAVTTTADKTGLSSVRWISLRVLLSPLDITGLNGGNM